MIDYPIIYDRLDNRISILLIFLLQAFKENFEGVDNFISVIVIFGNKVISPILEKYAEAFLLWNLKLVVEVCSEVLCF